MKKIFYFFLIISFSAYAQINVTSNNLPNIGDTVLMAVDYSGNFTPGTTGVNQNWNFSSASGNIEMLLGFIDPFTTPYQSTFPNSNLSVKDGATFYYLNRSTNGLAMLGLVDSGMTFLWDEIMLPTPLNYLDTLNYTSVFGQIDTFFSPPIPAIDVNLPGPYLVDSVTVTYGSLNRFIVDSWGQIQIPNGTYDALRIFQDKYEAENYLIHVTDTFTGQSQWIQPPPTLDWQESRYLWRTNDSLINWNLVEMQTDSSGNPYGDINFYLGNSINNIVISPAIVDILKIEDISCFGYNDGLIMLDVWGTALPITFSWVGPNGFSATNQDIFNLSSGMYEVTITDANGNVTIQNYVISEPPILSASISQSALDITANVMGGTPPYSYLWNTGDTLATITPNSNGLYSCDIIDKMGCIITISFDVTNIQTSITNMNEYNQLIKITDILGRKSDNISKKSPFLYMYNNGLIEKKIIIE